MNKQKAWPDGLKRTKQRMLVLDLLDEAGEPLSAAALYERLTSAGHKLAFSTVYRILEAFVAHELAEQISVAGSEYALYERKRPKHRHYAVCIECSRLIPLSDCPFEHFEPELSDFRVLEHRLELSGICADCDSPASAKNESK